MIGWLGLLCLAALIGIIWVVFGEAMILRRALYGLAFASLFTASVVIAWPSSPPLIEPETLRPYPAPFPPKTYPYPNPPLRPCGR